MERFSTCELREKEVINLCDGVKLGCPCDFEFNVCEGKITAIIVPRPSGFLGLSHARDLLIPWDRIECIGSDAILVRLQPTEYRLNEKGEKRNKYW
ncbi:MAG: YlmC/YmxH family sporulation protein [Ruminococcaceae bacterium]|nr:YlmC/YmxH family sporulation protein [Oscillospiraceae bacterium]